MRPAKRILCISTDELLISQWVTVFESKGYRILSAHGIAEALNVLEGEKTLDLVVMDVPLEGAKEVIGWARQMHPVAKILLTSKQAMDLDHNADAWHLRSPVGMVDLLENMKVLLARRRGPKKGTVPIEALAARGIFNEERVA